MESLLRLSGLLSEDDDGSTDLGTLEKRLANKTAQRTSQNVNPTTPKTDASPSTGQNDDPETPRDTPNLSALPSPTSPAVSTEESKKTEKEKNEPEVEALSDMMCSLVTNNCGETRYIGKIKT